MTQAQRIKAYMSEFGSISPMEAFAELGITKLATRISEMRAKGEQIIGVPEETQNRYGERVTFYRYRLPFEEEQNG